MLYNLNFILVMKCDDHESQEEPELILKFYSKVIWILKSLSTSCFHCELHLSVDLTLRQRKTSHHLLLLSVLNDRMFV